VPLAGLHHVIVAIDAKLDRTAGVTREDRSDAGKERRLRLLATEGAAHPPAFDRDRVEVNAQRMRDLDLHFAGMLRRAVHSHATLLIRNRERDLPFQIEVILAATAEASGEAVRRRRDGGGGFAARKMLGR